MAENPETARDFPHNTCPASRHAEMIADQLESGRLASILDDPRHAGGSVRATVEALWAVRTALNRIGAALLGAPTADVPWWSDAGRVVDTVEATRTPSDDFSSLIEAAMATYATSEDSEEKAEEHQDAYDKLVCAIASLQRRAVERGDGCTRWRHVKRGTEYEEIGRAEYQWSTGSRIGEGDMLVIYRGGDGKIWAREESEFEDGRFDRLSVSSQSREG